MEFVMPRTLSSGLVLAATLITLAGCGYGQGHRALTGAAIGAGGGAIIGAATGLGPGRQLTPPSRPAGLGSTHAEFALDRPAFDRQ